MIDEDCVGTKPFSPTRSLCLLNSRCRDVSSASEILKTKPLAAESYDGSVQSFAIACGNVTANRELRDFGLFSLRNTMDGLERLFDQRGIGNIRGVALFHKDTFLVHLTNTKPDVSSGTVLFLDCHNLQTCEHTPPEEEDDQNAEMKEEKRTNEQGEGGEGQGVLSTPSSQSTTGLVQRKGKVTASPTMSQEKSTPMKIQWSPAESQETTETTAAVHSSADAVNEVCFEHAVKRSKEEDVVEEGDGDGDDDVKDIQGLVISVVAALALFFTLVWMTAPTAM